MEKQEEVKLRVDLTATFVSDILIAVMMLSISLLPFTFFEPSGNPFIDIIFFLIFLSLALIFAMSAIIGHQTAILDENGIIFRSPMREIAKIKWMDIVKVEVKDLETAYSRGADYNMKWIVIYTSHDQKAESGKGNKKNKPPWIIKYNNKNVETINDFLKKYTDITLNIKQYRATNYVYM